MFSSLELRNFKGFKQQTLDLAPLNIFIGPNSTGKSSVLQALAFLKQSHRDKVPRFTRGLVELGSFEDIIHLKALGTTVEVGFSAIVESLGALWPNVASDLGKLPIRVKYGIRLKHTVEASDHVSVAPTGGKTFDFAGLVRSGSWRYKESNFVVVHHQLFSGFTLGSYSLPSEEISPTRQAEFNDAREDLNRLGTTLEHQLGAFYLVPATRGFVGQEFDLLPKAEKDLIAASGYHEFASNAASALAMNRPLEDQVSEWLQGVTGFRVQANILENRRVSVILKSSVPHGGDSRFFTHASQEGFGTNQLATVFLQVALAGEYSTVGIEEPELHLHPRSQRLFIETLVEILKNRRVQFILTTHSERVVSRILLLVAKKKLTSEDVAIWSFQKKNDVCSASRMEIDAQGRVLGGLPGFFEEDVDDLSGYIAALQQG